MNVRPILFSGAMVQALLAGRKTATRRVLTPQPPPEVVSLSFVGALKKTGRDLYEMKDRAGAHCSVPEGRAGCTSPTVSPRHAIGDLLWVRERGWMSASKLAFLPLIDNEGAAPVDPQGRPYKATPSIHMPRWASRLTLKVTGVKVERLQDISEADAIAEGVASEHVIVGANCNGGVHSEEWGDHFFVDGGPDEGHESGVDAYADLWDRINAKKMPWSSNPWVTATTFTVHRQNVDDFLSSRENAA